MGKGGGGGGRGGLTGGVRLRGSAGRGASYRQLDARRESLMDRDSALRRQLSGASASQRVRINTALRDIYKQIGAIDRRISQRMRRWNSRKSRNRFGGL
jgi:hypothetical protein